MGELAAALVLVAVLLWTGGPRRSVRVDAAPVDQTVTVVDPAAVLDLIAVAIESGADLPRALAVVGDAVDAVAGDRLRRVSAGLLLGAEWSAAWGQDPPPAVRPVMGALGSAWTTGASAVPALRAAAVEERQQRRRRAREASSRLGVRLVVPLGVCFLPAFVLVGVVPVVMSLVGRLG
ncbi:type II secretion system F family protein [Cellulomonas sp. NPDC089187]|uniref:type II secretion system F family protein n=1 Tax=Cellulomonas sp. NPDC089187 TaxID=3154970 RepID=UPI00342B8031